MNKRIAEFSLEDFYNAYICLYPEEQKYILNIVQGLHKYYYKEPDREQKQYIWQEIEYYLQNILSIPTIKIQNLYSVLTD